MYISKAMLSVLNKEIDYTLFYGKVEINLIFTQLEI